MEYVGAAKNNLERRILRYSSSRKFNVIEVVLIVLVVLTLYTFLLVSFGANSALLCSNLAPYSGQLEYINLNGYTDNCGIAHYDRVGEHNRMLKLLRLDLLNMSKKMKEVNLVIDSANKEIPEKQQELSQLGEEIEAAQRSLDELRDRRNVRVFLPHTPIYPKDVPNIHIPVPTSELSFDYSRCSISSFFPIFLEKLATPSSPHASLYYEEFKKQGNLVNREKACLIIHFNKDTVFHPNDVLISTDPLSEVKHGIVFHPGTYLSTFGSSLHLEVGPGDPDLHTELASLLPVARKNLLLILLEDERWFNQTTLDTDVHRLKESADSSGDRVDVWRCGQDTEGNCDVAETRRERMRNAVFCVLAPGPFFQRLFWESLRAGCVPVVLSVQQPLPFQEFIDWRLAVVRLAAARLPELHFVLRSYDTADLVEMKRNGRLFFVKYLADVEVVTRSILVFLSQRIGVPLRHNSPFKAKPLFNDSFRAPVLVPVNSIPASDDEYLGPLEGAVDSLSYNHNFTFPNMYSGAMWNQGYDISRSPEFLLNSAELPAEAEFFPDVNIGYRPIEPGSGDEFSKALGGNRAREQFTVVMITYNRDAVLTASLERLHRLPYLNKVIVIWNNVGREPVGAWPRLHVPVEFIKVSRNSLNNRFIPWDRIKTEAVLSLDDDIDLKQHEIIFAFRVWRENRDRLVGFPARYHARFGSEMFYNSNHTCQYSLILTGAAFLHKTFLYEYSQQMPAVIREHVDKVMNCEDIAMNFLVSHLTRKPPIKTTSKWTLRCPTCTETLSQDEGHFRERHECIRLFTKIYGYNPLKFTQFRADSVLFKTRLPADKQKCFRYV